MFEPKMTVLVFVDMRGQLIFIVKNDYSSKRLLLSVNNFGGLCGQVRCKCRKVSMLNYWLLLIVGTHT